MSSMKRIIQTETLAVEGIQLDVTISVDAYPFDPLVLQNRSHLPDDMQRALEKRPPNIEAKSEDLSVSGSGVINHGSQWRGEVKAKTLAEFRRQSGNDTVEVIGWFGKSYAIPLDEFAGLDPDSTYLLVDKRIELRGPANVDQVKAALIVAGLPPAIVAQIFKEDNHIR